MHRVLAWLAIVALIHCAALPARAQAPVQPRFDINGFRVEGNTLLTQRAIDAALAPYRGKGRDFGDVKRAVDALQAAYQKAGYGAVQVAFCCSGFSCPVWWQRRRSVM